MIDHYQVLGVSRDASRDEIRKAYRTLAMRYHPDHNPTSQKEAEERFKEIHAAYEILGDDLARRQYDYHVMLTRMAQGNTGPGTSGEAFVSALDQEGLMQLLRQLADLGLEFGSIRMHGCRRGFGPRCRRW